MPYNDPDPQDPQVLVGVSVPSPDPGSTREMAYAFAEEFARIGFEEERILSLFNRPFYAGPHRALQALGAAEIQKIVRESVEVWGRFRVVVHDRAIGTPEREKLVQIGHRQTDETSAGSKCGKEVQESDTAPAAETARPGAHEGNPWPTY